MEMNFYEEFDRLKKLAMAEMRSRLEAKGGEYVYPEDNRPIVAAYPYEERIADFFVKKVYINEKNGVVIVVGNDVDSFCETSITLHFVEGAHIQYLWEYME